MKQVTDNLKADLKVILSPPPNPKARPEHKKRLIAERLNAEDAARRPEPMSILRKRERELPERESVLKSRNFVTAGMIQKAATAVADWDNSDPFAYGRMALHVKQGYLVSADVVKEFEQRTVARRVAKAREVERELVALRTAGIIPQI